jgi:NitT/TauT family transport system permease protein
MVLLLWEFVIYILNVPIYLVPAPSDIFINIYKNITLLLIDSGVTLLEAVLGFCVGCSVGFIWAVLFAHSPFLEKNFYGYFVAFQTIPVIAIAPLLVLWFGNGLFGKVIMSAFICFFPVVVNTTLGFKYVDKNAIDLMRIFNANKKETFFKLRLPSAMPYIFTALKISASFSVIGAIVSELAGAKQGIGFRIIISSYRLDTPMMFSAIFFASVISLLFAKSVSLIEKRVFFWRKFNNNN